MKDKKKIEEDTRNYIIASVEHAKDDFEDGTYVAYSIISIMNTKTKKKYSISIPYEDKGLPKERFFRRLRDGLNNLELLVDMKDKNE